MEIHTHLTLVENIILKLQDLQAVRFGSREWGGFTEQSDHDYVLPLKEAENLLDQIKSLNNGDVDILPNKYYVSGYYVRCRKTRKTINVTGCKVTDFKAWKTASNMMLNADCATMPRNFRHLLFETILSILKQIPASGFETKGEECFNPYDLL